MKLWLRNAILRLTTEYTGIHRCRIACARVKKQAIGRIGNGVQVSDRTAAVRPNRSHKPLIERSRRGQGDEAESEDLPVKIHVWFFGLKNNMSLLHGEAAIGGVFIALQDMLDEAPDVLYFCFWINWIPM